MALQGIWLGRKSNCDDCLFDGYVYSLAHRHKRNDEDAFSTFGPHSRDTFSLIRWLPLLLMFIYQWKLMASEGIYISHAISLKFVVIELNNLYCVIARFRLLYHIIYIFSFDRFSLTRLPCMNENDFCSTHTIIQQWATLSKKCISLIYECVAQFGVQVRNPLNNWTIYLKLPFERHSNHVHVTTGHTHTHTLCTNMI